MGYQPKSKDSEIFSSELLSLLSVPALGLYQPLDPTTNLGELLDPEVDASPPTPPPNYSGELGENGLPPDHSHPGWCTNLGATAESISERAGS